MNNLGRGGIVGAIVYGLHVRSAYQPRLNSVQLVVLIGYRQRLERFDETRPIRNYCPGPRHRSAVNECLSATELLVARR